MPSMPNEMPGKSWQPRLRHQSEADALEAARVYFGAHSDAEAMRHCLRVLVRLIELESEGYDLILCTEEGDDPHPAISPKQPEPTGADISRRWTTRAQPDDQERSALVSDWAEDASSWREVWTLAIVRVGEMLAEIEDGRVLWAQNEDDQCLIVL